MGVEWLVFSWVLLETFVLYFLFCFCAPKSIFVFLCTVSGCNGGKRTRSIAKNTWSFSFLSHLYFYQGSIFCSKRIFIPPPLSVNKKFSPSHNTSFLLLSCPFCFNSSLFCIYFTLFFQFYSLLYTFFLFFPLSSFFSTFPIFFSSPLHIFPPNSISWYSPRGWRVFSKI